MERSAWWFLLPLVLGVLGSAIAYSQIRKDDPDMVKWIWVTGAVMTIALALTSISPELVVPEPFMDL